jgi:hypothetical protein
MKTLKLNSTAEKTVDLEAIQAYHAAAGRDSRRDARIRGWHRLQAAIIASKLRCWDWDQFCRRFSPAPINLRSKQ